MSHVDAPHARFRLSRYRSYALVVACTAAAVAMIHEGNRSARRCHRQADVTAERVARPRTVAVNVSLSPAYSNVYRTRHFALASEAPNGSLAHLGTVAEQAFRVASGLVLLPREDAAATIPIYICTSLDGLRALEHEYRLPWADRAKVVVEGAFYKDVPMIAIVASRRTAGTVAHEVGHAVLAMVGEGYPRAIDEGIAEYVEYVVLGRRNDCKGLCLDAERERKVSLQHMSSEVSLQGLLCMSYREYQDAPYAFAASWCLVKVLARLDETEPGRLADLVRGYGTSPDKQAWLPLARAYVLDSVERLWREEIVATTAK